LELIKKLIVRELSKIEQDTIIEYFMKYIIEHPNINTHLVNYILESNDRLYYGGIGFHYTNKDMYLFNFKNCPYCSGVMLSLNEIEKILKNN
jgi:hypothetical protein